MAEKGQSSFRISLFELRNLMESRGEEGVKEIQKIGGIEGICEKLNTSSTNGIGASKPDLELRRQVYGANISRNSKSFLTRLRNFFNNSSAKEEHYFYVVRGGDDLRILGRKLVVGDVCLIKCGDTVPADGVLVQCTDLEIDESSLTGETEFVKMNELTNPMLLSGTVVMNGCGKMIVTAVGANSQCNIVFSPS